MRWAADGALQRPTEARGIDIRLNELDHVARSRFDPIGLLGENARRDVNGLAIFRIVKLPKSVLHDSPSQASLLVLRGKT